MSPYDGSDRPGRRNRGALGPWVPLIMTVAVATIGVAAWVWSERDDDEDEDDHRRRRRRGDDERNYPPPAPSYSTEVRPGEAGYGTAARSAPGEDNQGWGQRMSGALRRTPSPQQFLEGASRTVSAGITAAGAAVGNALSSIREEDKNAYRDHQTWSEEAEKRKEPNAVLSATAKSVAKAAAYSGKKKKVAVVVSADADNDGVDDGLDYSLTHASILSHLPQNLDFSRIELYVLIFSPDLKHHPLDTGAAKASSLGSSYADVAATGEVSNKLDLKTLSPETPAFNSLWSEAEDLVAKNTMIFPFTTHEGHLQILRHLKPDTIYLQAALSGPEGANLTTIQHWFGGHIVVVVGGDHGDGGLADSDSETEEKAPQSKGEKWWEKEYRVGVGRRVDIVDHLHVSDDWAKRIENKE